MIRSDLPLSFGIHSGQQLFLLHLSCSV